MKKNLKNLRLLLTVAFAVLLTGGAMAQEVTDEQYEAANESIEAEATYHIYTLFDGWFDGDVKYYLTDDGRLTDNEAKAGQFVFHRLEVPSLYKPVSWQVDQFFTNPDCWGGYTEWMYHLGYIRTNASQGRDDYESQVWYKDGDTYAVRATNAASTQWGANSFWTVEGSEEEDGLPNADYSLEALFVWRLEKIADPPGPFDPDAKEVNRLTNLPHVYIDTFTGRDITSKTNYVYARMWYVDENDDITFYDSLQVRGRGNSTWGLAKKPYKLKFQSKVKLLGKGYAKTKKWTMLANHGDKTLIRNALTSAMGERMGLPFNPAAKFVDLTLNNKHVGNYQISDQIDVRPHRVDITEQDEVLTDSSDITGGYLFESDGSEDFHTSSYWDNEEQATLQPDGFHTHIKRVPMRIHYPEPENLDAKQVNYAKQFINEFEQRLYADDFTDLDDGYRAFVDSVSLANWYLCTEMSGNVDGFYSTFFYKEQQDDHLYWGPLWDYDIAYNNDSRTREGTSNTLRQLMKDASYGYLREWIERMWEDPWFAQLINRRFHEALDEGIEDYLNQQIDDLTQLIDESQQLNYQRWGINQNALRERVLYSTYDEYVSDLRSYIHDHLLFLQEAFAKLQPDAPDPEPDPEPEPTQPDFPADSLLYYVICNAGTGTALDVDIRADGDVVVCNARNEDIESQQWRIFPLSNGYLYVVNRATGYALNDPTEGEPTATTLVGTQLNTAPGDSLDVRQQWDFVAQANDRFNLVSRFSKHSANLSGGSSADGTTVVSYTSDGRDAVSNNRLWTIDSVGMVYPTPEPLPDGINLANIDYALAYNPANGHLHFGTDDLSLLTFPVRIYDAAGHLIRTFRASDGTYLSTLPQGLYLVTWTVDGRRRTVKLMR